MISLFSTATAALQKYIIKEELLISSHTRWHMLITNYRIKKYIKLQQKDSERCSYLAVKSKYHC